ncbi:protoporphyrinogen/coproporphyrinogen oxidase [Candidatus Rhodoluna planktonica]|uniref:Amine oxidase domain-containing protein n=1 Tax=Candidatus Rhodoluna planktonica TaxID=535712 RepID=A0A1D9E0L4_9MICO|nr:FAD-dependent oxidoreductase [Candidatus Rhodoluna planktonica]AOY56586.1 hypothetical protein A4Z71_06500 [Candidatus Rhodoluna planktonica]
MNKFDRVVIGAGFSGLLAAFRAVGRGETVAVFDSATSAGGLIQQVEMPINKGSIKVDSGAESFSIAGAGFERLVNDLGVGDKVAYPSRNDARIVNSSEQKYKIPHGYFGIPASLNDVELDEIISKAALDLARKLDSVSPPKSDELAAMTIAQLVELRLGSEFVDKLVDPVIAGIHGSSARDLNVRATLPALIASFQETGSLTEAASALRGNVDRPGSAVAGYEGGVFRLVEEMTNRLKQMGVHFEFDRVVSDLDEFSNQKITLATSLVAAQKLFKLPSDDSLEAQVDSTLVIASVESNQLNGLPLGSGALVSASSGYMTKATTHLNAKWKWISNDLASNEHLIRFSLGRARRESAIGVADEELFERVRLEASDIYGVSDIRFKSMRTVRWPSALYRPSEEVKNFSAQLQTHAENLGVEVCGSFISGNGLLGIIRDHHERMGNESVKI